MKYTKSRFGIMKTILGLSVMGDSIQCFHGPDAEIIHYHNLLTSLTEGSGVSRVSCYHALL